jgi:hypothetical protein
MPPRAGPSTPLHDLGRGINRHRPTRRSTATITTTDHWGMRTPPAAITLSASDAKPIIRIQTMTSGEHSPRDCEVHDAA